MTFFSNLFKRGKYPDVILPMCVLAPVRRRLEPTKKAILEAKETLNKASIVEQSAALCGASGHAFYNTSKFTLRDLKSPEAATALADFRRLSERLLTERFGHHRQF